MEPFSRTEDISTGIIAGRTVQEHLDKIQTADILVGVPAFNNAGTIGHVIHAVQAGLAKYFPEHKAVIVVSDGGSSDGTIDVARNSGVEDYQSILLHHRVRPAFKMAFPYLGIPGKGSALRAIFEIASALQVKACAVVDSDLRSITPEWIELLLKPVLNGGFDYVAPLYHRHKYDGTITNSIIYPFIRAIYGKRIRQPIGGDFGFSGRLAEYYLSKQVWETDVARYGIDVWMTSEAIANNFKVAQAFLGAKIHDPKDPGSDLSAMLAQVTGAVFGQIENHVDAWKQIRGSESVPTFGFRYSVGLEPINVNTDRMRVIFREGVRGLCTIWAEILSNADLAEVEQAAARANGEILFPQSLWTRIIYDYAMAYHNRVLPREQLLKSLTPLYLGRTASFIRETEHLGQDEVEAEIEKLCLEFEQSKDHLIKNWK